MKDGKIILFDAYGTLFKLNTDDSQLARQLGNKKDAFLSTWRNKIVEYTWLTSLMEHWEEFNTIVSKAILFACKFHKVDPIKIEPILMKIYSQPFIYPDVKNGLKMLKKAGYTCSIVSNGELSTLTNAVTKNQIVDQIDQIFSASTVQKYKVSPKVYRMATAHYNTGPSKMYFVSSNAWDIAGAHFFGYQTIWVNRDKTDFDSMIENADYEVSSIGDVLQIIDTNS